MGEACKAGLLERGWPRAARYARVPVWGFFSVAFDFLPGAYKNGLIRPNIYIYRLIFYTGSEGKPDKGNR